MFKQSALKNSTLGRMVTLYAVLALFACDDLINNPEGSPQSRCLYGSSSAGDPSESRGEASTETGFNVSLGRDGVTELVCFLAFTGYQFGEGFVTSEELGTTDEQRLQDAVVTCALFRQWRDGCLDKSDSYIY